MRAIFETRDGFRKQMEVQREASEIHFARLKDIPDFTEYDPYHTPEPVIVEKWKFRLSHFEFGLPVYKESY